MVRDSTRPTPGGGLQHGQLGGEDEPGGVLDLGLEAADGGVEGFEQGQVGLDASADEGVGDVGGAAGPLALVLDVAGDGGQVGLPAGGVDVAVQVGALADEAEAGAEEIAEAPPLPGVGVGGWEGAALEESGDGLGVLAVALGLVAVHGLHGVGVAEDEGDLLVAAGVGEPVPAVHALAGDEEAVAEGGDGTEEGFWRGRQVAGEARVAVGIEDDEEEVPGVQIDAGIESGVGGRSEGTHGEGLLVGGCGDVPPP
jgi:hypothetical protein